MGRALIILILLGLAGFAGWIAGSVYPAPARLIAFVGPDAVMARARGDLQYLKSGSTMLQGQKLAELQQEATKLAAEAGSVIMVEHKSDAATVDAEKGLPQPSAQTLAPPKTPVARVGAFEASLSVCPGMTVSNEPAVDAKGQVENFTPTVDVNGEQIAVEPVAAACLSSGFGYRNGKLHKGVDYFERGGGQILAAGNGTIIEMKYRDDYGNMYLIDYGHGVYTRYAHLSAFAPGLKVGSKVTAGEVLGLMGNTAAYPIPVHLHYELLLGNYDNPKRSFGLTPTDIFKYLKT